MIDRDTIIKLAREAGFEFKDRAEPRLEHFAALVAKRERLLCFQVCRDIMDDFWTGDERWETARHCSEMILERGEK